MAGPFYFLCVLAKHLKFIYLTYMTLYEFRTLPEKDKAKAILQGHFCMVREDIKHTIVLYKMQDFYIEVYFHNQTNRIVRCNPFSSKMRIGLYFDLQKN
jgi:hypothetical protein